MKPHYVTPLRTIDLGDHVFQTGKYEALTKLLATELNVPGNRRHLPYARNWQDVEEVHTRNYVAQLMCPSVYLNVAQSELPATKEVIDWQLQTAAGTILAAELARECGIGFHIGGGFHHAFADHPEGFCYINDVAVAAKYIRSSRPRRILIVDCDVHQGNGTASMFQHDPDTFTYSIHQENNYPIRKEKSNLDRGLDDEVGDREYIKVLHEDLLQIAYQFTPDIVFYLAGVDTHTCDTLGGLSMTADGIQTRDELVINYYRARGIPVVVLLAGGYGPSVEETARLHLRTAIAAEKCCG